MIDFSHNEGLSKNTKTMWFFFIYFFSKVITNILTYAKVLTLLIYNVSFHLMTRCFCYPILNVRLLKHQKNPKNHVKDKLKSVNIDVSNKTLWTLFQIQAFEQIDYTKHICNQLISMSSRTHMSAVLLERFKNDSRSDYAENEFKRDLKYLFMP